MKKITPLGPGIACLLLIAGFCSGCETFLARRIAHAPNHGRSISVDAAPSKMQMKLFGVDGFLRVPVGPPQASLALWIIEPVDQQPPRGTVLVLHGFGDGPFWMLGKARHLASQGYRAVLVAQRGYGDSSGDMRTFGVVEKQDLTQVIDALEARQLLAGKLGVWGMSYGGAMALEIAGHDPRVRAVVSVAGFSSMREVTPHFISVFLPVTDWLLTDEQYQEIIDRAGAEAGFDPDDASALRAVERTDAAILLLHGSNDMIVPYAHAQRLHAHANSRCRLVTVPNTGHVGIWLDMGGLVEREADAWFARWLN